MSDEYDDRTEFFEALKVAARNIGSCGHPGCTEHGNMRFAVHTYVNTFGADWSLDRALEFVKNATQVAWVNHWLAHDLRAQAPDGWVVHFEVRRPDKEQVPG